MEGPGLRVLPFSLAAAPQVFTKPSVAFLRDQCVIYLDNLLLMHQDKEEPMIHTSLTLNLLETLGFLVNYSKSHWVCDQLGEERAPVTKGESLSDKSRGDAPKYCHSNHSKGANNIAAILAPSTLQEPPSAQAPGTGNSRLRWEDDVQVRIFCGGLTTCHSVMGTS